jgi:hypothetical protein
VHADLALEGICLEHLLRGEDNITMKGAHRPELALPWQPRQQSSYGVCLHWCQTKHGHLETEPSWAGDALAHNKDRPTPSSGSAPS